MRLGRLVFVAVVLAVAPVRVAHAQGRPPPPAPAAPKSLAETLTGDARSDYAAGKLLFLDGDFASALIKFKSAYASSADARLLWNMAACEKNLRHYARTDRLVREYLEQGGALLTESDRAEAKALLDTIFTLTTKLTLEVSAPGADIELDDEHIGTSPLDKPLVVDIGTRKLVVKKAGFKEVTRSIEVGASREMRLEVKLVPEVHEGTLTVTTVPTGRVLLDGKPVGTGGFHGKLHAGGHTLRIEAPGMRPVQQEIVVGDDEERAIDVPLEREFVAPPPPPPAEKGPGGEVGLSTGPGVILHGTGAWLYAVRAEIGWKPGWPTMLGMFVDLGAIDASDACGTLAHGPYPVGPVDVATRFSFQSCKFVRTGLQLAIHFRPRSRIDPFIALEPGFRLGFYSFSTVDPLGLQNVSNASQTLIAIDLGTRLGVDVYPVAKFASWRVGAYFAPVVTLASDDNPQKKQFSDSGSGSTAPPTDNQGPGGAYVSLLFGLRTSLTF